MWKQTSTKVIFKHPRITLIEDQVELPSGQVVPYLKFMNINDSVTIICQSDGGDILLQQEYSYPVGEVLYQFPGGKIEVGEDAHTAAVRELKEESGLLAHSVENLGWFYVNNRRSSSKMYVLKLTNLEKTKKSGGDIEEDIIDEWLTIADVDHLIKVGSITNYALLASWAMFKIHP